MDIKRLGKQTVKLANKPSISFTASIAGPKEGNGPLAQFYDLIIEDELYGEKSWERAESKLLNQALKLVSDKALISESSYDYIISGDLLNQCMSAHFAFRESGSPFIGIYGACSTMAESLSLGAMLVDGGYASRVACATSSHFCSAEKQFRFPLELGTQRAPTSQWTVTGAGAVIVDIQGNGPFINYVTTGVMKDAGIKDVNNMGAAMAPAAADTIIGHFLDTGLKPEYYDLIITGDLGVFGNRLCRELLENEGMETGSRLSDCGIMVYDIKNQDVHCGGSGCGCSAVVLCGYLYRMLLEGKLNNILFIATGSLHSPVSYQQGETIPCIAHAVSISGIKE